LRSLLHNGLKDVDLTLSNGNSFKTFGKQR
jgi:hypothetical protein